MANVVGMKTLVRRPNCEPSLLKCSTDVHNKQQDRLPGSDTRKRVTRDQFSSVITGCDHLYSQVPVHATRDHGLCLRPVFTGVKKRYS